MASENLGIRVKDDATGLFVATRGARIEDNNNNERVVELVDLAGRPLTLANVRNARSSVDPSNLDTIDTEAKENLIIAGDVGGTLVVMPQFAASGGVVSVTPIYIDPKNKHLRTDRPQNIESDDDDGYMRTDTYALDDTGTYVFVGRETGYNYESFLRFDTIALPRYANIDESFVRWFQQTGGNGLDSEPIEIYACADPQATFPGANLPSNQSSLEDTEWIGPVEWDASGWNAGQYANTPSLNSIIQPVLNREDWTWDSAILLRFKGPDADGVQQVAWGGSINNTGATLRLSYNWFGYDPQLDEFPVIGMGETKQTAVGTANLRYDGAYFAPLMAWDLFGNTIVGLHITALTGTVTLYAGVI